MASGFGTGAFPGWFGAPRRDPSLPTSAEQGGGIVASQERAKILQILKQSQQGLMDPNSEELKDMLYARGRGNDVPFTPNVLAGMYSQNADSAAAGFGSERDMVRQSMANQGLTGSGMETASILSAMRAQGQQVRTGRRDITTRAQLENFGARERAQAQIQEFLRARAGLQQTGQLAEANYRSTLREELPAQQQPIPGGNSFGVPSASPFNQQGWDKMLQDLSQNQDYFGNPQGSPNYNTQPIPGSPAAGNTGYGSTGYIPKQETAVGGDPYNTIMQSMGLGGSAGQKAASSWEPKNIF